LNYLVFDMIPECTNTPIKPELSQSIAIISKSFNVNPKGDKIG